MFYTVGVLRLRNSDVSVFAFVGNRQFSYIIRLYAVIPFMGNVLTRILSRFLRRKSQLEAVCPTFETVCEVIDFIVFIMSLL